MGSMIRGRAGVLKELRVSFFGKGRMNLVVRDKRWKGHPAEEGFSKF